MNSTTTSYKFEEFNSETNFIKIVDKFLKIQPIYYDTSRLWWVWNFKDYYWELKDEIDILNYIDQNTRNPSVNSKIRNELIEALKRRSRLNKPKPSKQTWIQFKNKIIDVKTEEEYSASPEYFITNPIPINLGNSDETPTMDKIFEEWVGKDYVQTLYEIISYCLLPSYPIHRLFCLYGEGLNGKSKFLELITNFVGQSNVTSTELDTLLDSRFEITRLHKKLVCLMGETNFNEIKKTSILKKLTGGDLIGYEYKNKDPFHDYNYAKILISTNNIPPTQDKTIGFIRRWTIIDFPNTFDERFDVLDQIPNEEYRNLAKKSIKILKNLLSKREFHNEGNIEERGIKYEEKSNPFEKFWKEMIIEDVDSHIFKFEFRKELDLWCKENRFRIISDRMVANYMKDKNIETQKVSTEWHTNEYDNKRYNAWSGIKWRVKT